MSEPFLGEIRCVSFNFAPRGWAHCFGQILPILHNEALYSLIGTMYGGDGETTFHLPDLSSRTPIGYSNGHHNGRPFMEFGSVSDHYIPTSHVPANPIKIILDNP